MKNSDEQLQSFIKDYVQTHGGKQPPEYVLDHFIMHAQMNNALTGRKKENQQGVTQNESNIYILRG